MKIIQLINSIFHQYWYSKLIASKLGCNFVDCFVFCFRNFNEYIHNEEYLGYDEDDKYIWPKCKLKIEYTYSQIKIRTIYHVHLNNFDQSEIIIWLVMLTLIGSNIMATRKLAVQFATTAIEAAMGRADCWNNSLTKNHGIDPGPVANPTTNRITKMMDRYEATVL